MFNPSTSPSQNSSDLSPNRNVNTNTTTASSRPSSAMSNYATIGMARSSPNNRIDDDARIRNAAAQARHRAKRKAYVAQLEQTLAQLQDTVKNSKDDARYRQLEEENFRLQLEIQHLRAQLESSSSGSESGRASPSYLGNWTGYDMSMAGPSTLHVPSVFAGQTATPWTADFTGTGSSPSGSPNMSMRYNPMAGRPPQSAIRHQFQNSYYAATGSSLQGSPAPSDSSFEVRGSDGALDSVLGLMAMGSLQQQQQQQQQQHQGLEALDFGLQGWTPEHLPRQ